MLRSKALMVVMLYFRGKTIRFGDYISIRLCVEIENIDGGNALLLGDNYSF